VLGLAHVAWTMQLLHAAEALPAHSVRHVRHVWHVWCMCVCVMYVHTQVKYTRAHLLWIVLKCCRMAGSE
jgi:hypothetical protein